MVHWIPTTLDILYLSFMWSFCATLPISLSGSLNNYIIVNYSCSSIFYQDVGDAYCLHKIKVLNMKVLEGIAVANFQWVAVTLLSNFAGLPCIAAGIFQEEMIVVYQRISPIQNSESMYCDRAGTSWLYTPHILYYKPMGVAEIQWKMVLGQYVNLIQPLPNNNTEVDLSSIFLYG